MWKLSPKCMLLCLSSITPILALVSPKVSGDIRLSSGGAISNMMPTSTTIIPKLVTISEQTWRHAASRHSKRIRSILEPGLTNIDDPLNSGLKRASAAKGKKYVHDWTALDPHNPIYNFLIEYYGLKGAKGPRRLSRWSPDPSLLLNTNFEHTNMRRDGHCGDDVVDDGIDVRISSAEASDEIYKKVMEVTNGEGGILLENANEDDMGGTLHLRGAIPIILNDNVQENDGEEDLGEMKGILYNPAVFYDRNSYKDKMIGIDSGIDREIQQEQEEQRIKLRKTVAPLQWYSSILSSTLESEPIMHCHGLHEWAMQYHPEGADAPPSAKYQSSLNLRVSREVINKTVERKGISCTHVDALRFFAPAAGPLNHHGASLERTDQIKLEQKACVHAHMDLLKIILKLGPFVDSNLLVDVLEISLMARKLDVEASPYDATPYGAGIVPVEKSEGRKIYRERQKELMELAEPVRIRLLEAYTVLLKLGFHEDIANGALPTRKGESGITNSNVDAANGNSPYAAPERFARAEPGGKPWRQNLIETS